MGGTPRPCGIITSTHVETTHTPHPPHPTDISAHTHRDVATPAPRKTRHRLSRADEIEIARRYERGETQLAIAQSLGVARQTVNVAIARWRDTTKDAKERAAALALDLVESAHKASKVSAKRGKVEPHKLLLGVAGVLQPEGASGVTVNIGIALPGLPGSTETFAPVVISTGETPRKTPTD